ncbi:chemotaxis protein CheW [Phenylobacterium sp.]|uniref:chemotaxis protein CheW n=1 Tax=Phenylobacterium sp. TaxID=1871053 RepID=UPI0035B0AC6A
MEDFAQRLPQAGEELIEVRIGDQQYAIDIMSVREIRGWTTSTPLPHAPAHVLGMINLRGAILPVVDLGARLGIGSTTPSASSVVVVAHINGREVGLLVDAVCDIITVTEGLLQPPPDIGDEAVREFVRGVMTTQAGIVSLLSLSSVLPAEIAQAA